MKLLKFLTSVLILAFAEFCHAQAFVVDEVDARGLVQDRFVARFAPDYALFNQQGAGLVRKGNEWSLVRLRNIQGLRTNVGVQKKMYVFKRVISEDFARKILAESAADSLFAIGQEHFDALPETCEGEPGKKRGIAGRISDAGTINILEYTSEAKREIQFYGAESYYRTCYPHQPEYNILDYLLNAFSVLEKYVDTSGH